MPEPSTKNGIDFHDHGQTAQELQAVESVIASFVMVAKNYAIYPESHATCQNSLQTVKSRLDAFIENYGDLRFEVTKDRLLFKSETVQQDDPKTEKLAFPLFRDGIQWLEFKQGLELWEISGFFKIYNDYKMLQEEAEGDLVTALWEMDFPHLQYSATDVLWKAETLADFSTLKVTDSETPDAAMQEQADDDQQDVADTTEAAPDAGIGQTLSTMDRTIWQLTPEESRILSQMVAQEEQQSGTQDVLDVLELILRNQNQPEDYSSILEFIKEEFKSALAQGNFQIALDFLEDLRKTYQSCKIEKPWARPLLGDFFIDISGTQVLGVLKQVLPTLDKQHTDRIEVFRRLFLRFPPAAITALAPLLLEKLSVSMERKLMETIGSLALKDIHPLEQLLDRPEESLVKKLVFIIGHIKGEKTGQILLEMTHHESAWVRLEALKALARRDENMTKELFPLIDDPVLPIRRMMWKYLEKHQDPETGNLIRNYLDHKKIRREDHEQILNCYKTLVRCDSQSFVPFLRESLISQGLNFSFDRSLRRQGAALALLDLDTEEAQEVLGQASKSLFPNIRSAYQKALKVHK
ncbi:MAG: HEAT repeat domain-containing protein [Deltaproteobacteria bacterium]|nr:HEAT repeat domain-containing protein [Deltaproteobacteria bacterium]